MIKRLEHGACVEEGTALGDLILRTVEDDGLSQVIKEVIDHSLYIPSLSLTCMLGEKVVACLGVTQASIKGVHTHPIKSLMLAFLVVCPHHRNLGLGSAMVKESINRARDMGYRSIFTEGCFQYFKRFGFQQRKDSPLLQLEIVAHTLVGIHGEVSVPYEMSSTAHEM